MSQTPAKPLDALFTKHPRDIGETYAEHAGHALFIGGALLLAGIACLIHALIPGLFVRTASNTVDRIISLMNQRGRPSEPGSQAAATMIETPSN